MTRSDQHDRSPFQGVGAVQKRRVHEEIVERVRDLIESGRLAPGDKLPPERELADIFGVSRHAVREAIRTLEERRILASRRGAGTYVATDDSDTLLDGFSRVLGHEHSRIADIFQFRRMIEPEIAALAAETATAAEVDACEALLHRQRTLGADDDGQTALDSEFHMTLARATGNGVLVRVVENVVDVLAESRSKVYQSPVRAMRSVEGHKALIDALRAKDPDRARRAMEEHLRAIEETIFGKAL